MVNSSSKRQKFFEKENESKQKGYSSYVLKHREQSQTIAQKLSDLQLHQETQ